MDVAAGKSLVRQTPRVGCAVCFVAQYQTTAAAMLASSVMHRSKYIMRL